MDWWTSGRLFHARRPALVVYTHTGHQCVTVCLTIACHWTQRTNTIARRRRVLLRFTHHLQMSPLTYLLKVALHQQTQRPVASGLSGRADATNRRISSCTRLLLTHLYMYYIIWPYVKLQKLTDVIINWRFPQTHHPFVLATMMTVKAWLTTLTAAVKELAMTVDMDNISRSQDFRTSDCASADIVH